MLYSTAHLQCRYNYEKVRSVLYQSVRRVPNGAWDFCSLSANHKSMRRFRRAVHVGDKAFRPLVAGWRARACRHRLRWPPATVFRQNSRHPKRNRKYWPSRLATISISYLIFYYDSQLSVCRMCCKHLCLRYHYPSVTLCLALPINHVIRASGLFTIPASGDEIPGLDYYQFIMITGYNLYYLKKIYKNYHFLLRSIWLFISLDLYH